MPGYSEKRLQILQNAGDAVELEVWRNTPRGLLAKAISARATYGARGHRPGEPVPLYGADSRPVADDEFAHAHPFLSGTEIRSTRLTGHLLMVDSTQDAIATALGTPAAQLSDPDDWSICQQVTRKLFDEGFHALRLPSSRSQSGTIVIVERSAALSLLEEVEVVHRTIPRRPPSR